MSRGISHFGAISAGLERSGDRAGFLGWAGVGRPRPGQGPGANTKFFFVRSAGKSDSAAIGGIARKTRPKGGRAKTLYNGSRRVATKNGGGGRCRTEPTRLAP